MFERGDVLAMRGFLDVPLGTLLVRVVGTGQFRSQEAVRVGIDPISIDWYPETPEEWIKLGHVDLPVPA